ncbi:MAG: aromatic ring-hydroxylating dioxygenase subunit alpha [Myxococcales bacterium]|nr:aromatic ring-hydroxylating dioxygenase subunit alpha [Myxococcales bacterium]
MSRQLMAREILEESVLLYRKEDGTAVAVSNRCPHRFAPLHKGRLVGDVVECAYHGLQFDCSGACVKNPHPGGNGPIPARAALKSYPLVEKYGALWIWMGYKTPDESLIPDFSWLDGSDDSTVRGSVVVKAHYELITDNVLDLTHLPFLHAGGLGSAPRNLEHELVENVNEGDTYWCKRSSKSVEASPDFERFNPKLKGQVCDKANAVRWNAPAHVGIFPTYWYAGTKDENLTWLKIGTMMTPISENETLQFWSLTRNFAPNSEAMDAAMRRAAAVGLESEDVEMIEAQHRNMGTSDIFSLNLASLPGDTTPNRVRKALRKMIEEEQRELQEGPLHRIGRPRSSEPVINA